MRNIACVAIYFISSITAFNSSGIGGRGRFSTSISPSVAALDDDVVLAPFGIFVGKVFAKLRAPALFAKQRGASDGLGDDQQAGEIHRGVPSVVVLAVARDARPLRPRSEVGRSFPAPAAFHFRCERCRPGPASLPAGRTESDMDSRRKRRDRRARARRLRSPEAGPRQSCGLHYCSWRIPPQTARRAVRIPPDRKANCRPAGSRRAARPPLLPRRTAPAQSDICESPSTRMPPIM